MPSDGRYQDELDYFIDYTRVSAVYFNLIWDAAGYLTGEANTEAEVKEFTLKMIGDLLDRGVKVGDMSPKKGEYVIPWNLSRERCLRRIAKEMDEYANPTDYLYICWFVSADIADRPSG